MAAIKKGDVVRQVIPVIEGTVTSFQVDQETGALQYLVEWSDGDGNVCSKYFGAGEVEAVA